MANKFIVEAGASLIKCTHNDKEYVKLPNGGDVTFPFIESGVTVTTVTYEVDYEIEYNPLDYLTDGNDEHYPLLVGGRPKDRGGK